MIIITLITILTLSVYTSYDKLLHEIESLNDEILRLNDEVLDLDHEINSLNVKNTELHDSNLTLNTELKESLDVNKSLNKEIKKLKTKPTRGSSTRGKSVNKVLLGTFEATAYDDSPESQGKWVGQTASGMKPQKGVIAVDPKVIPLGTKLYVEGYGNCIAGDTGGAIKGIRIDVFFNTKSEVYNWGRKKVKVYKLGE